MRRRIVELTGRFETLPVPARSLPDDRRRGWVRLPIIVNLIAAVLGMTGCAAYEGGGSMAAGAGAATAEAQLRNAAGTPVAGSTAVQVREGVRLRIKTTALPAGAYAAHVHAVGRCDAPDFSTAGPHWNPTNQQHGRSNPQGMHMGDLPNIDVGANGRGSLEIALTGATLSGGNAALLDADGAAIVIHERADDHRTDPAGNSGKRIACGVLR
jgi:Cu-Zn family superoxide dismutase